jgi:hypothetical protein
MAVKHFGFRSWQQGRELARRDFLAIGAVYSKFLKCGRIELAYIPAYEFTKYALWPPIRDLLHLRSPRGMVRITAFRKGFMEGLHTPFDKTTMRFVDGRPTNSIPLRVSSLEQRSASLDRRSGGERS